MNKLMSEQTDDSSILKLLSEEETADTFHKNKDKILSKLYQLTKDKSMLQKRIENLEKN